MSTSEEYLDNLLKSAMENDLNNDEIITDGLVDQITTEETIEETTEEITRETEAIGETTVDSEVDLLLNDENDQEDDESGLDLQQLLDEFEDQNVENKVDNKDQDNEENDIRDDVVDIKNDNGMETEIPLPNDPELDEINQLLKVAESAIEMDDDMLALLQQLDETVDENGVANIEAENQTLDDKKKSKKKKEKVRKERKEKEKGKGLFGFLKKEKKEEVTEDISDANLEENDSIHDSLNENDIILDEIVNMDTDGETTNPEIELENIELSDSEEDILGLLTDETEESIDIFADLLNAGGSEDNFDEPLQEAIELEMSTDLDLASELDGLEEIREKSTKKKRGFFGKILDFLTEEVEEEEAEIKEKKPKKAKKGDIKKESAESLEDEDEEPKEEVKKKKKEKKPKKIKEKKVSAQPEQPMKKLPTKMVVRILTLGISLCGLIYIGNYFVTSVISLNAARTAYYEKDYKNTYLNLEGKKLNASDAVMLERSKILLSLQRKIDSYNNYKLMNYEIEALDALISGCDLYRSQVDYAMQNNIIDEYDAIYNNITAILSSEYSLDGEHAIAMYQIEDATKYLEELERVLRENSMESNYSDVQVQSNTAGQETKDNVLDKERISNLDGILDEEQQMFDQQVAE